MERYTIQRCPYVGLTPYTEEQAAYFFGRERETRLLASKLYAARLTLLYGGSGVGKSSVLRAGVAQTLREEDGAPVVVFSAWQVDPVAGLRAAVAEEVVEILAAGGRATELPYGEAVSLGDTLRGAAEHVGPVMLILDQFEEYFLYNPRGDAPGSFAVEFAKALNRDDVPASFLISIREDAYTKLDHFKGRIPNLFDNYLRLDHLDYHAARAAIERPIEQYNLLRAADGQPVSIEPALVEAVLEQVRTGQVVLGETGRGGVGVSPTATGARIETPYLQLVMTRLWDEEMGAGSRVLRLETLERLGGAEEIVKTHLEAVMSTLSPGERHTAERVFRYLVTPSGTKIAYPVRDLVEYECIEEMQLTSVVGKLSRGDVRVLRQIAPAPGQPADSRYERYEIFHDVLAPAILDWRARFVQKQEQAEAKRRLALERRRVTRLRLGLIGLFLLLVVMGGLAFFSIQQRRIATDALAFLEEQDRAIPYFKAIMRGHKGGVNSAAFSPDGRWVVTASADGTARVWEVSTGDSLAELRGHKDTVYGGAFSPDGKWVVTASRDGTARVWDADTGRSLAELRGHEDSVYSGAFSPDGKWVVTASADGTARVWEASTGRGLVELLGHTDIVWNAAFSPDGRFVVTASRDGTARLWEAPTGHGVVEFRGHMGGVRGAAFSPDGRFLVTASVDGTACVWEASTGHRLAQLDEHRSWVSSAVFSPDGKLVVTASDDGTARVWEWREATGNTVEELRGHASGVRWAMFSPDGKWVVTTSWDNTARVWEVSTGDSLAELRGHTSWVSTAEFSPDGRLVVTAGEDGTARVWQPTGDLPDAGLITYSSQDEAGKSLYAIGSDGTAVTLVQGSADVRVLAVSPDRRYLATALSQDGELGPSTTHPRFIESGSGGSVVSLVVVSADGVGSTTVVTDDVPAVDAAYTADGELVVAVLRDSTVTYMLTQEDGSDPRELYRSQNVLPTPTSEATEEAP